jgi:hypothetical protein
MQFSSFFKLCTLLLIQSGAVYSTFVCNDNSIEDAKVGICLRKINTAQDPNDPTVAPLLDKKDFLGKPPVPTTFLAKQILNIFLLQSWVSF